MAVTVRKQERPPIWRNTTILKWVAQVSFLFGFIAIVAIVVPQVQDNLAGRNITFGWDWLTSELGFLIREGIDTDPATGSRTVLVGMVNTLRVTISGVIAATILGTIIGIARLSNNWIVNKLATVYIESIRNIPLLLQMFFWSAVSATFAILDPLDSDTLEAGTYWVAATRKGVALSWVQPWGGFYQWMIWLAIGFTAGYFLHRRNFRIKEETGKETYPNLSAFAVFMVFAIIGWFAHPIFGFLGTILDTIGDLIGSIPTIALQVVLAIAALFAGFWWIKRFLDQRRTPAGLAKLTDDDWFRMIAAGVTAVAFAGFFLIVSGLSSKTLEVGDDFFSRWLAPKFETASNYVDMEVDDVVARVAAGETLEDISREQELRVNADLLGLSDAELQEAIDSGVTAERLWDNLEDPDDALVFIPPKKLVFGLTHATAENLNTEIENGTITPEELAAQLETFRDDADRPLRWSRAEVALRGSNFLDLSPVNGINITPGFFAVWIAVTLYTGAFIAEIVRAGILAVSKGQTEAAGALGLNRAQALRFIILPQAFRIIFPPLGNQYLNLFKNTSLGIAVAYPEIVSVGFTTSNQTGQTLPVILVWMGFYLSGSLVLSSFVNFYNRRLQLVER
ncbi:MAG: ABC transporter permease subunit [Acidimicrobiia bacterium]